MKWTAERVSELRRLRASGLTNLQLAAEFRTTVGTVAGKLFRISPNYKRKPRPKPRLRPG